MDDPALSEAPETTEAAAPQTEAPAPEQDPYEKRYGDLRAEFDKRNSLLDRARQGDLTAIQELNLPYEEPEPEPVPGNDLSAYDQQDPLIQALIQQNEQLTQQSQQLAQLSEWQQQQVMLTNSDTLQGHIETLAQGSERELSARDKQLIFDQAAMGGELSPEKTESAFKAHLAYLDELESTLLARQTAPKQTSRPVAGQAAEKQPDLDNPQERRAYMEARLRGDA